MFTQDKSGYFSNSGSIQKKWDREKAFTIKRCSLIRGVHHERFHCTSITNPAGIIVTQISDHLPYFVCINNMKVKKTVPKYIYIKQSSDRSINTFKAEVKHASIYDKLDSRTDANPSSNYDILDEIISQAADTCMPS